ncbi:MAG: PIG-L family deacetylase [Terrimicrobiaceae bacterium]|nr:PIG-L family deacetylase [Terrimicrobiaceae bacterium]
MRVHVPDGTPFPGALERCTHLGICAHQDDLEFLAFHGIVACHGRTDRWFGGVVCTDGAGSARQGRYAGCSDEDMKEIRAAEQERAADLGEYGIVIQLGLSSRAAKDAADTGLRSSLSEILSHIRPEVVYTHNPADKHDSHLAVFAAAIETLRSLDPARRPKAVYGCEGWRNLDWLDDREKVVLDVSGHDALARELNAVFDSQIAGGKRYDLAVEGRRRAHATFFDSHACDAADSVIYAMDLTPLVEQPGLDIGDWVTSHVDRFRSAVADGLRRHLRG